MEEELKALMTASFATRGHSARKAEQYCARALKTYALMRPHLPAHGKPVTVLDIGCGWAGLDICLARHYADRPVRVLLMDGEVFPEGRVKLASYHPDCTPWHDANDAASHLRTAGIAAEAVPPDPSLTLPADVIVSTRSWGHHYPVDVYLPLAVRSLREEGRLFLDLRAHTKEEAVAQLSRHFDFLWEDTTSERRKCYFCAFAHRAVPEGALVPLPAPGYILGRPIGPAE
jgi:hypothetical protein